LNMDLEKRPISKEVQVEAAVSKITSNRAGA
jgi:hypothetical protein